MGGIKTDPETVDPKHSRKPAKGRRRLSTRKKVLFAAFTVLCFFAILEGLLTLCRVNPVLFSEDPYVGFAARIPLFVEQTGPDGTEWMVTAPNKRLFFNVQRFPREKAEGTFRIFCLGGSTTYGRPYDDATAFSGWLRAYLAEADPTRKWEVINAGGISYASYRVALLMEELVDYDPDLFIVYTGHNEFLERRTYAGVIETPGTLRGIGALLGRTRTYALVKKVVDLFTGREGRKKRRPASLLSGEVKTLLDHTVGPTAYHRDDDLRAHIAAHFRFNLARMLDMARAAGAGVILVRPGCNLKDCTPFKSEHVAGLAPERLERWKELQAAARRALAEKDGKGALADLDAALALDDRYAETHFLRGRALLLLGRPEEARRAFLRARDEDVCPLRAPTEVVRAVEETASDRDVPLVDFDALVSERSKDRIPGREWFFDHVHPTIEGHRILALALLDEMTRLGMVHLAAGWNEAARAGVRVRVMERLDPAAHGRALRNLSMVLAWAGKYEEAYRLAGEAVEKIPGDPDAVFQRGVCAMALRKDREAEEAFHRAMELAPVAASPHTYLGQLYRRRGEEEAAEAEFRRALELDPEEKDAVSALAVLLREHGREREARRVLQRYLKRHPGDRGILKLLSGREGRAK